MDLTATAFGLLVTALGGLFTAVVLLARRELDRGREQVADLGLRLAAVERQLQDLDPLAAVLRQKPKNKPNECWRVRPLLEKADRDRLLPLIYRHTHGTFSSEDEAELRRLIGKEYPDRAQRLDRESLMGLAHGIIGVAYYFADRRAEANA